MAFYFRYVPNLDYINRSNDDTQISNYTPVKNLFKRGKIRDDIFGSLVFFNKYNIIGDERPDNVAQKVYGDSSLDWIVLLSNNIINVYDEWPMSQEAFDNYLLQKYGSYERVYSLHHRETLEIKDSLGTTILKPGLTVPQDFRVNYYDYGLKKLISILNPNDIMRIVTNYEYEIKREDKKRNIFLLKENYVPIIRNDMEKTMPYKEGGEQYVDPTLKRVDNIRLYDT